MSEPIFHVDMSNNVIGYTEDGPLCIEPGEYTQAELDAEVAAAVREVTPEPALTWTVLGYL